jgi:hypothetical protein
MDGIRAQSLVYMWAARTSDHPTVRTAMFGCRAGYGCGVSSRCHRSECTPRLASDGAAGHMNQWYGGSESLLVQAAGCRGIMRTFCLGFASYACVAVQALHANSTRAVARQLARCMNGMRLLAMSERNTCAVITRQVLARVKHPW